MWHHPGGTTAQLTKKAPPSLNLVWGLSEPRYSNFHSKFQFPGLRAFQRGKITFPGSTGCKMAGRQSLKCETNFHFLAIYIVNREKMEVRFTLQTLTTCHFTTSWPRKSYYTFFWKALSSRYWNLEWKLEYLGSERLQTNFSEGGAFLVNWAVVPPGWCHT